LIDEKETKVLSGPFIDFSIIALEVNKSEVRSIVVDFVVDNKIYNN